MKVIMLLVMEATKTLKSD
ncbi:Protein of unknown function [Escherichia coli]|nr:Protein of unknown function [Escherichia coli]CDU41751.1 Protein of unknown function [Escherichia coli]